MDAVLVSRFEKLLERLEVVVKKNEGPTMDELAAFLAPYAPIPSNPPPEKVFDELVMPKLVEFVDKSKVQGELYEELALLVAFLFAMEREFIEKVSRVEKPIADPTVFLINVGKANEAVQKYKDTIPKDDYVQAVSVGANCLYFIGHDMPPAQIINMTKESLDEMMYFINRALKKFKTERPPMYELTKIVKELFFGYFKLLETCFKDKSVWLSYPKDQKDQKKEKNEIPAPPPPPPVKPDILDTPISFIENLMADLNVGLDATKRLKKVSKKDRKAPVEVKKVVEVKKDHEEKKGEVKWTGQRWVLENLKNVEEKLVVKEKKMPVYIFNCEKAKITISGKANSIIIDKCKEVTIVCEGVVSSCESINSSSVKVHTSNELPTLSIQSTRGCHLFVPNSKAEMTQIVSCSSTNMLVTVVDGEERTEMSIPEQFKTIIDGKTLFTHQIDNV